MGLGVIHREARGFSGSHRMDELVAKQSHFPGLGDLVGVVLRAERIVAPSVGVDAVEDVEIVLPEPVFLFDGGKRANRVGGRRVRLASVNPIRQNAGDLLIAGLGWNESAGREGLFGFGVEIQGRVEEIDEREGMLFGDPLHRGGVELKVRVLGNSVREVAFAGLVFVGDGGNQHQAGGGGAVIGLAQRVEDEGLKLRLVVGYAFRSVEGLVVAEECEEGIRLDVGEPLVGRGEEPDAVVLGVLRTKFLRAREGPLRTAGRVRAEAGRLTGAAHVTDDELLRGIAEMELGFQTAVIKVAFGEAVADENEPLAK